jgi:hypothetical protein
MSTIYRISRNIEASFIDFLTTNFNTDWTGVTVEKSFKRIYSVDLPSICVRVGDTSHSKVEIGADSTQREAQVLIDIFGSSDGNRLDMKDYIVEKIKNGLIYYDYEIENGAVKTKSANGRIRILTIDETPINFDIDKSELDVHDRYRHLLTLTISLGRVET